MSVELETPMIETAPKRKVARYLSRTEVAEFLGLASVKSLSRVVLPPPDALVGVHKGWLPATIEKWNDTRPGPGWWGPRGIN
jgi:hypothetical protein